MAHEASKAALRRMHDPAFAARYFVGHALDVGAGEDGLSKQMYLWPLLKSVREWDVKDGDGMVLDGVANNSFDLVHSSHSLEHMQSARAALLRWLDAVKPNGHVVALFPDEDLYEQGVYPSTWNSDHKHTFRMHYGKSWSSVSLCVPDILWDLSDAGASFTLVKLERLEHTWNPQGGRYDRTAGIIGESSIEMVLRKRA